MNLSSSNISIAITIPIKIAMSDPYIQSLYDAQRHVIN